jgi:predicted DNA-binding transcriptional regulator AlpA
MPQQDLVGIPEIASRLGVSRRTVATWRYRHQNPPSPPRAPFPPEFMVVSGRPVWDWAEVEQWAKTTGRIR